MTTALDRALGYRNELSRNRILNGGMMVSQENGSAAGTASGYYAADQWTCGTVTGGTFTYAQVASVTPGSSPNRLRFTVTAADAAVAAGDGVYLYQRVEGYRVVDLLFGGGNAKPITVRFGCKGPAGTYSVTVLNSATNRSYVAEYVISAGEANTDVVKSVTIPGDQSGTWATGTAIGLEVRWGLMAGTTWQQTPGAWSTGNVFGSANQFNLMGTNGNVFELFDVSLTDGYAAPAFQIPDYASELLACCRYFQILEIAILGGWAAAGSNSIYYSLPHVVPMRAVPSKSVNVALTTSNATVTNFGGTGDSTKASRIDITSVAAGQYIVYAGSYKLNSRL